MGPLFYILEGGKTWCKMLKTVIYLPKYDKGCLGTFSCGQFAMGLTQSAKKATAFITSRLVR